MFTVPVPEGERGGDDDDGIAGASLGLDEAGAEAEAEAEAGGGERACMKEGRTAGRPSLGAPSAAITESMSAIRTWTSLISSGALSAPSCAHHLTSRSHTRSRSRRA